MTKMLVREGEGMLRVMRWILIAILLPALFLFSMIVYPVVAVLLGVIALLVLTNLRGKRDSVLRSRAWRWTPGVGKTTPNRGALLLISWAVITSLTGYGFWSFASGNTAHNQATAKRTAIVTQRSQAMAKRTAVVLQRSTAVSVQKTRVVSEEIVRRETVKRAHSQATVVAIQQRTAVVRAHVIAASKAAAVARVRLVSQQHVKATVQTQARVRVRARLVAGQRAKARARIVAQQHVRAKARVQARTRARVIAQQHVQATAQAHAQARARVAAQQHVQATAQVQAAVSIAGRNAKVAAIFYGAINHYSTVFERGVSILGTEQYRDDLLRQVDQGLQPSHAHDFFDWRQKYGNFSDNTATQAEKSVSNLYGGYPSDGPINSAFLAMDDLHIDMETTWWDDGSGWVIKETSMSTLLTDERKIRSDLARARSSTQRATGINP